MSRHPISVRVRVCTLREHLRRRFHTDFEEVHRLLDELEAEIDAELSGCTCHHRDHRPAHIHLTAHTERHHAMSDQIPAGHPIRITAAVTNAEGAPVPDQLSYTTTSGTITTDDPSTRTATITSAGVGPVTVTAVDGDGLSGSVTFEVVDPTPAAISLTAEAV